jgi:hypothetical protein
MTLEEKMHKYKIYHEMTETIYELEAHANKLKRERDELITALGLEYNIDSNKFTDDKILQSVVFEVGQTELKRRSTNV